MLLISINFLLFQFSSYNIYITSLLIFSFFIFIIGLFGIFYNNRNLLIVLLCIEVILMSIGLNFIFMSLIHYKASQLFTLFIITIAATESSIGLGLLITLYRLKKGIGFKVFSSLKN